MAEELTTMSTNDSFQILQIKTCSLKVNIHCDGCKTKVKKILKKIEGVCYVVIDSEQQKVNVYGNVDSNILINKLAKSGKYAELWPSSAQEISNYMNGTQNQGLYAPKSQPLLTPVYPRNLEDEMLFARYLKQSMGVQNQTHNGWDDGNLTGQTGSRFIDQEGSQLGRSFNGGLPTYNGHQSGMPMYQYPSPMMMNMHGSMGNTMVHDNMHQPMSNHTHLMFPHGHYAQYY